MELAAATGITPLVGREQEVGLDAEGLLVRLLGATRIALLVVRAPECGVETRGAWLELHRPLIGPDRSAEVVRLLMSVIY